MDIYHQCGHNHRWNIDSITNDDTGKGLILSPVNIEYGRISELIPNELLINSWIDPQFYRPEDNKGKLSTYPFFPSNVIGKFHTTEYLEHAEYVAKECLAFQNGLDLEYLVIPTRYYSDLPDDHLNQLQELFVAPFISAKHELAIDKRLLLTIIVRPLHLEIGAIRDELLSWATSHDDIAGIYLIFDNDFYTKQIKDPDYLYSMLTFINVLRNNDLEVHIGYCGLEGILLSAADPTSVTVGSYENLRSFGIDRLITKEKESRTPPNPRIYSGKLMQWVANEYIPAFAKLVPNWQDYFDGSPYKEYLLNNTKNLHFQKSEIYKHYFYVYSRQIFNLPDHGARIEYVITMANNAINFFNQIADSGVVLDGDSDGSHLASWITALNMYKAEL